MNHDFFEILQQGQPQGIAPTGWCIVGVSGSSFMVALFFQQYIKKVMVQYLLAQVFMLWNTGKLELYSTHSQTKPKNRFKLGVQGNLALQARVKLSPPCHHKGLVFKTPHETFTSRGPPHRLVYLSLNSPKTEKTETLSILWFFKVSQKSSIFEVLKLPLQQTMILLWLIGLWRIIEPVFVNPAILNTSWVISAFWAALLTGLLAGYTRILELLPLSIFLLLGTLLAINPLGDNWFPFIAATYALILWLFSLLLPKLSLNNLLAFFDLQSNYGSEGGRVQTEHWIHPLFS